MVPPAKPESTSRPSDRRHQILAAAASLFHQRGFVAVSLEDIASAVGISAPAVYRHVRNKQQLLDETVEVNLRMLEACVDRAQDVETLGKLLGQLTIDSDHFGVILTRELDNLEPSHRSEIDARFDRVHARIAEVIVAARPELNPHVATVLAHASIATASSTSFNPLASATLVQADLVRRAVILLCSRTELNLADLEIVPPPREPRLRNQPWLSRPEAILAAAPWLLNHKGGYESTSLEDIGAAVGISGATVYKHFPSKADVFRTLSERSMRWMISDLEQALAMSTSGPDAMRRALVAFIELAHWFAGVHIEPDTLNLSAEQRIALASGSMQYMGLWLECVKAARPELNLMEQGVMLTACLGIANQLGAYATGASHLPTTTVLSDVCLFVLMNS